MVFSMAKKPQTFPNSQTYDVSHSPMDEYVLPSIAVTRVLCLDFRIFWIGKVATRTLCTTEACGTAPRSEGGRQPGGPAPNQCFPQAQGNCRENYLTSTALPRNVMNILVCAGYSSTLVDCCKPFRRPY